MKLGLDHHVCFSLYATSRLVIRAYDPLLKPLGLTYPQFLVMACLWQEEAVSVDHLGHLLYLDSGTLSPLLKRLEARGLISRSRDREDERRIVIKPTNDGAALKPQATEIINQIYGKLNLFDNEADTIVQILGKCRRHLDK